MQIFEFHFNPKTKEEIIFDSFIYEPENVYEKKLGNLYVAGELTNALPQNYRFLNNLASAIKENYYQLSAETSLERSLKNSLKKANNFLENQEKEGNISWLGNLNLAVVNIKDFKLNFTKVGNIKVLLARGKQITDIGQELEAKESEASPLKIFSNIVSGKLAPEDKIMILTKEISDLFEKEGVFPEVLSVFEKDLKPEKINRELKKILDQKRSILTDAPGLFLLIALETIQKEDLQIKEPITFKKKPSLKLPSFIPLTKIRERKGVILDIIAKKTIVKKTKSFLEDKISFLNRSGKIKDILILPKKKLLKIIKKPEIPLPKKLPSIKIPNLKESLVLIVILILILSSGNYIFKIQKQKEIERIQTILTETQQITTEAGNAFIFNDEKRANLLYQKAWNKILPLTKEVRIPLKNEVLNLKESIEKELFPLNKLERVSEPQIIFEFEPGEFSPQRITVSDSNLYFLNSDSDKIYNLEINKKEGSFIQVPAKIKLGINLGDSILFFSEPNQLFSFKKNELTSTKTIENPYPDFSFEDFSTFGSNLYFLDSRRGEIIKFKFEKEKTQLSGELWLKSETKKPLTAKSMAIDGSIWILNKDNNLSRYHINEFQKELILDFFPSPEGASKILTQSNLPYLYLLTPNQNRIVILDKNGEVVKQYQSEKFDNLKDLAVSENGKTIYLLNGLKIYQIEF